jgi:uncharacterized protein (UPF0335 family)
MEKPDLITAKDRIRRLLEDMYTLHLSPAEAIKFFKDYGYDLKVVNEVILEIKEELNGEKKS